MITIVGLFFGFSLYLPILLNSGWLDVKLINFSIFYNLRSIYDPYISKNLLTLIYASIIVMPMLISSDRHIRSFGLIIFMAGLLASFSYYQNFISVWCFFAGIVSLHIAYILGRVSLLPPTGE